VTDGTNTAVRYLDVYVKPSATYTDGTLASDWEIYGYVCINSTIGETNITPATTDKTNGFVDTNSATNVSTADEYHTYNLTIEKQLEGDLMKILNEFPFDVAFANTAATGNFQFIVETTGNLTITSADVAAGTTVNGNAAAAHKTVGGASAVSTASKDGDPALADDATVKYIGIPDGTKVTVTETQNVNYTTYTVTASETIDSTATDVEFDAASTGDVAAAKTEVAASYNQTAVYAQASAPATDKNVSLVFTNALSLISPTGVVMRFAPFAAMGCTGLVLFGISKRSKKNEEEAE
jgi:hypothetical protein